MKGKLIFLTLFVLFLFLDNFYGEKGKMMENKKKKPKYTNHLIGETSPYLLMHAHNPVDWYPWGQKAFDKAKKENKLVVISIGYAACHWCHVMEEQSFSDPDVARLMNDHFISIKVDREERPDIDQIYMEAAQLFTGQGGWPLNVITLSDGRPVLAGTYFTKVNWISLLNQIHTIYRTDPKRLEEQANVLTNGIKSSQVILLNTEKSDFNKDHLRIIFDNYKNNIDSQIGGFKGAPKFPMPVSFQFLLDYSFLNKNKMAVDALNLTLQNMAFGGIYDQIGGGFARYSTDIEWKVPHFEKMLYDNAQLVSLYSRAFQSTKNPLYKQVVYETLAFVERELTLLQLPPSEIGFYSSLDADSEGEEGKFYIWTKGEIVENLGREADLIMDYYNVTGPGNWENGKNILFRKKTDKDFAREKKISPEELKKRIEQSRQKLMEARSKRIWPALDDKILTAWNALMLIGYIDAYRAFAENRFLQKALKSAAFITQQLMSGDGRLNRKYKDGKSSINGFLDDYAFLIKAFISIYQATFDEKWLFQAEKLLNYAIKHFYDEKKGMFYFTSNLDSKLIARKMDVTDDVVPSSNSVMAMNLYLLGVYFYNDTYINRSKQMLNNVKPYLLKHATVFANWCALLNYFISPHYEVAIVGKDWNLKRKKLDKNFLPNVILMGGKKEGKLRLLESKFKKGQTFIYVCKNKVCMFPVTEVDRALEQIK